MEIEGSSREPRKLRGTINKGSGRWLSKSSVRFWVIDEDFPDQLRSRWTLPTLFPLPPFAVLIIKCLHLQLHSALSGQGRVVFLFARLPSHMVSNMEEFN